MRDALAMPPPAKKPRHDNPNPAPPEVEQPVSIDESLENFMKYIDDTGMQALLDWTYDGDPTRMPNVDRSGEVTTTLDGDEAFDNLSNWSDPRHNVFDDHLPDNAIQQRVEETPLADLPGHATTSSVAGNEGGGFPEAAGWSDVGLLADDAPVQPVAAPEGIPGSETDPMDIDVDESSRLPELCGSPLSGYEDDIAKTLQWIEQMPPFKETRGRKEGIKEHKDFPPSEDPLPLNLTLEQIAWSYPNHLRGKTLRPFVEAGWSGLKLWNAMQESAKDTKSKDQGWSKMTKRLTVERKRMEAESVESTRYELPSLGLPEDFMNEEFSFLEPTPPTVAGSSQDATVSENDSNSVWGRLAGMSDLFQLELEEQAKIISQILSYRFTDWFLVDTGTQSARVNDVWIAKAHEHEAKFVRDTLVDTTNIPFNQVTRTGMLDRLRELVKRVFLRSNPPQHEMCPEEEQLFREEYQFSVLNEELLILQSWTQSWQQHLEQTATLAASLNWDAAVDVTNLRSDEYEARGDELSKVQMPSPEQSTDPSWNKQGTVPPIFLGEFQATIPADQSDTSVTNAPRRQHRRHRRHPMFPNAPSTDVVLTEDQLLDHDNILENFPEHLTLNHVMERFLNPPGFKTGAYPTKDLVQKLRHHHNAKHGSDLNDPGRDQGVRKWVVSQQDSARRARRLREARSQPLTVSPASSDQVGPQDEAVHDETIRPTPPTNPPTGAERHRPIRPKPPQVQATAVSEPDPQSPDDFAKLLDPRLFE